MTVDELIDKLIELKSNTEVGNVQVWFEPYAGAEHTSDGSGGAVRAVGFSPKNFAHGNEVVLREQ